MRGVYERAVLALPDAPRATAREKRDDGGGDERLDDGVADADARVVEPRDEARAAPGAGDGVEERVTELPRDAGLDADTMAAEIIRVLKGEECLLVK